MIQATCLPVAYHDYAGPTVDPDERSRPVGEDIVARGIACRGNAGTRREPVQLEWPAMPRPLDRREPSRRQ